MRKQLRLTSGLVARVAPAADSASPVPLPANRRQAADADYDEMVRDITREAREGTPADAVWVFAYGSLIWNPAFDFVERRTALAHGWHRSFCLGWDIWFRGTVDRPALMMALDRGGRCKGVAFRLPPDAIEANLDSLVRREVRFIPHAFPARWIGLETDEGPLRGLTFAMDRNSGAYVGGLAPEQVADVLAVAAGRSGSMAEYLFNTVVRLEELGLHDRYLWRLQEMVAERIESAPHRVPSMAVDG